MKKKTFIVQLLDSKKPNRKSFTQVEDANFYSNDTDASLVFIPHEDTFNFQTAKVVMYNRSDESLVERDAVVTTEDGRKVASYELPDEIISHWGDWTAQPVFINGGEIYSGSIVPFSVFRYLMDNRPPTLRDVIKVDELYSQLVTVMDEIAGKDVISAPEIILARGEEDTLGERLDKEHNEVTAQLAQTKQAFNDSVSKVTVDSEVILARGGKTTLGERIDEIANGDGLEDGAIGIEKLSVATPASTQEIEIDNEQMEVKLGTAYYANVGVEYNIESFDSYIFTPNITAVHNIQPGVGGQLLRVVEFNGSLSPDNYLRIYTAVDFTNGGIRINATKGNALAVVVYAGVAPVVTFVNNYHRYNLEGLNFSEDMLPDKSITTKKLSFLEYEKINEKIELTDSNVTKFPSQYYLTSGQLQSDITTFDSYRVMVNETTTYKLNATAGQIFRVQIYRNLPENYSNFIRGITLQGNTTSFEVEAGQIIGITVTNGAHANGDTNLEIYRAVNSEHFKIPNLIIDNPVRDFSDNNIYVTHTKSSTRSQFIIYKQEKYGDGNNYLGVELYNTKDTAINADVWHLGQLNLYRKDADAFSKVADTTFIMYGEWETAIKEQGTDDFMGGNAHGDEVYTDFVPVLDGKILDTNTNYSIKGNKFTVLCNSILNKVDTPLDKVAKHSKYYEFTIDGILLKQKVEFIRDAILDKSYMTMLPVARTAGGSVVVNKAYRDNLYSIENLAIGSPRITTKDTSSIVMYNDGLGHKFYAKVDYDVPNRLPNSDTYIYELNPYAKFYFDYCGNNYAATAGEIWEVNTNFEFRYSGKE